MFVCVRGVLSQVSQGSAKSADGTNVPYFIVRPKDAKGPVPTILYGYGGFQISMTPKYAAATGAAWLERGGCYVEANIRGGGEFGPSWWAAAKRESRHRAYEDFEAVAEVRRRGDKPTNASGCCCYDYPTLLVCACARARVCVCRI